MGCGGLVCNPFVLEQVWWSPCPSRECPDEEELDIVVDLCLDHCLLLEQNPKIESVSPPTNSPIRPTSDNGDIDDLNFHVSKRKHKEKNHVLSSSSTTPRTTESLFECRFSAKSPVRYHISLSLSLVSNSYDSLGREYDSIEGDGCRGELGAGRRG